MPTEAPIPAQAPGTSRPSDSTDENTVTTLKGMPKALAANMDASLTVPTATSVRTIPAKLMIDNRIVVNNHLRRTRGGKVSFTHIIGWAMIRALKSFPSQNVFYDEPDSVPSLVIPAHINLGLAIDIPKPDGSRALVVPGIKKAEQMSFADFLEAYAKKQPAHPTFRDALETQRVCDAVLSSAKSHQWVNVNGKPVG
jgi:2-oxoglutarate dehydrogenase E1 component